MQPDENKWLALWPTIHPPTIDPSLEKLGALPRSTECLRHFTLSIEFWISPHGRLRQWIKLNVFLAAFLFIPAIVLMPVVGLVLHEVDGWLSLLVGIVLKTILLIFVLTVAVLAIKHFPSSLRGSSRKRK